MVRALLEGSKTQTRRIVKPQPVQEKSGRCFWSNSSGAMMCSEEELRRCLPFYSKYGQPGARLWVRETHLPKASGTIYRADFSEFDAAGLGGLYGGWKPSIFCKREYSRITLEITGVRAERLHDISEQDALNEGVESWRAGWDEKTAATMFLQGTRARIETCESGIAKRLYMLLWESINGAGSWDANPWVWVIEFKRVAA